MSYRDIRNFTEMMRTLGYPRLISMENFRVPNFSLVAEILQWLVLRYDPSSDIPMDIEHENDRVLFIKSVAQFMMTKAHIKLNTKRLYGADGMAVKELLKVTSVLYNAAMKVNKSGEDESSQDFSSANFDFNSKVAELKKARQLASEITVKGSSLHQLLGKEVELREIRKSCIGRALDLNDIETHIDNLIKKTSEENDKVRNQLENIASDEAHLSAKIEKRKAELERNQKRLKSLESVRPAFMDEYEQLEAELAGLYQSYIEKYRNLTYLEHVNNEMNKSELERMDDTEDPLRIAVRLKKENENMIRGSLDFDGGSESDGEEEVLVTGESPKKSNKPAVLGSMGGGLESDNDDSDFSGSEGVDDDELLDDDDDEEDDEENEDDDEDDDVVKGTSPSVDSDDNF